VIRTDLPESVTSPDYRSSHVLAGAAYDAHLQERPFDAYMAAWEARHLARILERQFANGVDRYLDFACGTGRVTSQIAALARESVGVDVSETMLSQARQKCPQTTFHVADLTRDELDVGQFDLVSCFRFFGNAQDELRDAALSALAKRMRQGACLLINSHRNPRALHAWASRLSGAGAGGMDLTLAKLRRLLSRHGFTITELRPIGVWLYRARLMREARANSRVASVNERRFGHSLFASIAPDLIVVARKA
jgi:SAM-dependent methyltransferase